MKSIVLLVIPLLLSGCIVGKYVVYPPVECGSLDKIAGKKPRIILSQFFAAQIKDGYWRSSTQAYPAGEISEIIYNRIKPNCVIVYPSVSFGYFEDTSSVAFRTLQSTVNDLFPTIFKNPDSLQMWRCSKPIANVDSTTYFYLPLLLENENGGDYSPRFYTLLVDSRGTVVYAQMIHKYFKPGMWAKDARHFEGDTKDITPLGGRNN